MPMRLNYKAPYGPGKQSSADQEEVIYEIASQAFSAYAIVELGRFKRNVVCHFTSY